MFRHALRNAMPSMFQRRLVLLLVVCGFAALALGVQTARLTTGESHHQALLESKKRLVTTSYIPTVRGRILDRTGKRVIAMDEPGYDVAVDYQVIDGSWAYKKARRDAYRANRDVWGGLSSQQKHQVTEPYQIPYDEQVELLWQTLSSLTGKPRADVDRKLNQIRRGVAQDASYLWHRWQQRRSKELGADVPLADVAQPIREEKASHSVIEDVGDDQRMAVADFIAMAKQQAQLPEDQRDATLEVWKHVEIQKPKRRRYPLETLRVKLNTTGMPTPVRERLGEEPVDITVEGVGLNIMGLMRDAWKEDINVKPFLYQDQDDQWQVDLAGYRDGDRVGSFGVEATCQTLLHGSRGKRVRQLDAQTETRIEPAAGTDIQLTIDIALQARVQALLSNDVGLTTVQDWHPSQPENAVRKNPPKLGDELQAAAVVIEVDTGEILAAATHPSMSIKDLRENPQAIFDDQLHRPFLDRAFGFSLQPGSTIKPLILVAAEAQGKYNLSESILCRGYLDDGHPERYRCWIFKRYLHGHGPLGAEEAIARSCNIFFYTLGERMGAKSVVRWLNDFGLGRVSNSGVTGETPGHLPDLANVNRPGDHGFGRHDAIFMGIGQGPVAWTPIQAANAYATLARGGVYMPPTVIKDPYRPEPREVKNLNLNPKAVDAALQGLFDVVHAKHGTGRQIAKLREPIFNLEDVTIYGKSGTAQGSPLRAPIDDDGDGYPDRWSREILRDGDHSWFIALVKPKGASRPKYAVAVVVEYGGSGSNVAGPIANQVVHALKDEGYLR